MVHNLDLSLLFVPKELLGQLIASALIDQFGLFGARVEPLSAPRLAGLALMGSGLALTQFFR